MQGYFDYNATTPLSDSAREAWLRAQTAHWQNPSSLYPSAGTVRRLLEDAREQFGDLLGCESDRIVFNSGATEGCNLVMAHMADPARHVAISAIEHPCVREAAWKWFGHENVMELPVNKDGLLDLDEAKNLLTAKPPALVALMAANNETGVIQPWQAMAQFCRDQQIPFLCDAVQWIGKQPAEALDQCSWATISAHKFGGPKGTGMLIIPEDPPRPLHLQVGGPQESGHRGGTENYPNIAAMLAAMEEAVAHAHVTGQHRDRFEQELRRTIPETRFLGRGSPRLPNTSMVVMPEPGNLKWLLRLGERGFAVSTGSACSAGKQNPSHVMAAMHLEPETMGRVLRFSSGPGTSAADWQSLADALLQVSEVLQQGERSRPRVDLNNL